MHKASVVKKKRCVAMIIATLAVVAGCENTDNWLKRWTDSDREAVILGAPGAHEYLREIYRLATGEPAQQAELFANAKSAAERTPGTSTQLRYALLLATPGHAEQSDIQAQTLLRKLLSEPELMTPAENALAEIHLREVEQRLALAAEADQLREEIARMQNEPEQTPTEDEALAQHIRNIEAQNRWLRRQLADAESKLEALSEIERSLREQSGNGEPR